jgi:excisionase family DNA binding protein
MVKEIKDYPIILTVNEIMEILSISKRTAYDLMDQKGFPCIRIGEKLKRVNRDAFFEWIDKQSTKSED